MAGYLDLIEETLTHFEEGAKSVRAYSSDFTYVITRDQSQQFWVVIEEEGFSKKKCDSLEEFYTEVFGIEARY